MRYFLILCGVLLLSAFAQKPQVASNTISTSKSSVCPEGIGAMQGDQPLLIVTQKHGYKVMVCGYDLESEYDIYQISPNGKVSSPLLTTGALSPTRITQKDETIYITSLIDYRERVVSVFEKHITCSKTGCRLLKQESCVFAPMQTPVIDWSGIHAYQKGSKKTQFVDEDVLSFVVDAALSGDVEAQDVLMAQRSTLKLGGAVSEMFTEAAQTLKKMKKMKCL